MAVYCGQRERKKKKSISTLFCEKTAEKMSFIMTGGKMREIKHIYLKGTCIATSIKRKDMLNVKIHIR